VAIDITSEEFKGALVEALKDETVRATLEEELAPGLKSALSKERSQVKELRDQLRSLEGIDPNDYAKLRREAEEAAASKAKAEGDWEKREAQLKSQFDEVLGQKDTRIKHLDSALHEEMIESNVLAAIGEHRGFARLLAPHVRGVTQMVEEDGKFRAVVTDESGKPRLAKEAKTANDYLTINDYVGSLRDDPEFAGAFDGTGASGGGATNEGGGTQPSGTISAAATPEELGRRAEDIASGKVKVQ